MSGYGNYNNGYQSNYPYQPQPGQYQTPAKPDYFAIAKQEAAKRAASYLSGGGSAAAAQPAGVAGVATDAATGGTVLANGTVVPGVATDAATGGTVLADGSVAGAPAASAGSAILPAAAAAYTGYRGYKTYEHLKDKPASFSTGVKESLKPANLPLSVGTLGLWSLGSGLASMAFGQHNQDARMRGQFRRQLEGSGFATAGPGGTFVPLADGSMYDIGNEHDGRTHTLLNEGTEWSGQARGWAMPIAALLSGGDRKTFLDTTAQLGNAMRSNTNDIEGIRANALSIFERLGMNREQAVGAINGLAQAGKISQSEAAAYINGVNTMFDGKGYVSNADLAAHAAQPQQQTMVTQPLPLKFNPPVKANDIASKIQGMSNSGANVK